MAVTGWDSFFWHLPSRHWSWHCRRGCSCFRWLTCFTLKRHQLIYWYVCALHRRHHHHHHHTILYTIPLPIFFSPAIAVVVPAHAAFFGHGIFPRFGDHVRHCTDLRHRVALGCLWHVSHVNAQRSQEEKRSRSHRQQASGSA